MGCAAVHVRRQLFCQFFQRFRVIGRVDVVLEQRVLRAQHGQLASDFGERGARLLRIVRAADVSDDIAHFRRAFGSDLAHNLVVLDHVAVDIQQRRTAGDGQPVVLQVIGLHQRVGGAIGAEIIAFGGQLDLRTFAEFSRTTDRQYWAAGIGGSAQVQPQRRIASNVQVAVQRGVRQAEVQVRGRRRAADIHPAIIFHADVGAVSRGVGARERSVAGHFDHAQIDQVAGGLAAVSQCQVHAAVAFRRIYRFVLGQEGAVVDNLQRAALIDAIDIKTADHNGGVLGLNQAVVNDVRLLAGEADAVGANAFGIFAHGNDGAVVLDPAYIGAVVDITHAVPALGAGHINGGAADTGHLNQAVVDESAVQLAAFHLKGFGVRAFGDDLARGGVFEITVDMRRARNIRSP